MCDSVCQKKIIKGFPRGAMAIKNGRHIKLKKEELMLAAWHPSRLRDWCISQDERKETENFWKDE